MKGTNEEQKHLFGDADLIFNALSTEVTLINEEIDRTHKSIGRKKIELKALMERKNILAKAAEAAKKNIKPLEPDNEQPEVEKSHKWRTRGKSLSGH